MAGFLLRQATQLGTVYGCLLFAILVAIRRPMLICFSSNSRYCALRWSTKKEKQIIVKGRAQFLYRFYSACIAHATLIQAGRLNYAQWNFT
jgi:hypothetical protein